MSVEKYCGTWLLVPELCIYQSGEPPRAGTYVIDSEAGNVTFHVSWEDVQGNSHELRFGGPSDGSKHPAEGPGITDVCYERIDELTLDSTAFNGERKLMYARRVASRDGSLLAVSQVIHTPTGPVSNFQVYRQQQPVSDAAGSTDGHN